MSAHNYTITLIHYRCNHCGKFWAHEDAGLAEICATCLRRNLKQGINHLEVRLFEERESSERMARSINALRGVITRLKRRAD